VIRQEMKQALDAAGIHIPLDGIQIRNVPVTAEVTNAPSTTAPAQAPGHTPPPEPAP